ncbi:RNA polymerase sigma factor [Brucella anthropi]|uniref:RNA polymerase sigma factor n=1 Tax=Brucella anthropi TaxID=529 RepID=UPI00124BF7A8|nr:RNA polymerase sigma factor [Brucella anthropi]KAB2786947.1 RNA polymerase sigma factor [Brucella anthropi]
MGSGTPQSHEADVSHPASESFEGQLLALLPVMRRYSRSLAKSDAEGEDLLQDCVAKALSRRGQWRGLNLRGWILTMMTNLYRNGYKSRARTRHETLDAAENVSVAATETDPFQLQQLEEAINSLPEDNRAVLMLVVVEGYSYGEAAEMLGIPVGTVMSRLSRARHRLAEHMSGSNIVTLRRNR